jgi:hypothetical protein
MSSCQRWATVPSSGSRAVPYTLMWNSTSESAISDIAIGRNALGCRSALQRLVGLLTIVVVFMWFLRSNENKMSDGWRDGASLRVEGGISSEPRNQSCQSFAPS